VQEFAVIKLYGKFHFQMAVVGKKYLHLANKCIITVRATKAILCQKCHLLCPQPGPLEDGFEVQVEEGGGGGGGRASTLSGSCCGGRAFAEEPVAVAPSVIHAGRVRPAPRPADSDAVKTEEGAGTEGLDAHPAPAGAGALE
jgi:hypothetical protein